VDTDQEVFMRFLILSAMVTALTAVAMSPPAQAAQRHNRHTGVTGAPTTVYQQQLPYGGYGWGTDPDPNVRSEMLRDPPNDR
jgi:hypothetical protein